MSYQNNELVVTKTPQTNQADRRQDCEDIDNPDTIGH